ncbi:MAG TPA: hypothetical protein VLV83_22090, partial [Acidobacteriota bacterium]|nr:hypothetical protein [Acidobacteriota bacterium]
KTPTSYTEEHLEAARVPLDWAQKVTFYKGEGCSACGESGYKGRQGLYEVMAVNSRVRKAIMTEASTDELRDIALDEGMLTLRMDGLKKVERGITSLEEVIKETAAQT